MSAQDDETLEQASRAIHDAHFEPRSIRHDEERATLVVPFQQEGWPSGPSADAVLVGQSWRAREYRVAFFHGELAVQHVEAVVDLDVLGEMGVLLGLGFNRSTSEVEIHAVDTLRVRVERLQVQVTISDDVAGHVRRGGACTTPGRQVHQRQHGRAPGRVPVAVRLKLSLVG